MTHGSQTSHRGEAFSAQGAAKASPLLHILLLLVTLAIGLALLLWGFEAWCADRIYPGVTVWGVHVGGLHPAEAAAKLRQHLEIRPGSTLTLRGPDLSWGAPLSDLGISVAAEETAARAFQVGRAPSEGLLDHLRLLFAGQALAPILSFDEPRARLYLQALAEQIDQPAVDATLRLQDGVPVALPAQTGRAVDIEASLVALRAALSDPSASVVTLVVRPLLPQVADAGPARERAAALLAQPFTLVLPNPREGDPGPWTLLPEQLAAMLLVRPADDGLEVTLDPAPLRSLLESLTSTLAIQPVDARFHFDETTGQLIAIAPSADGRALDVEGSLQSVLSAVAAGQTTAPLVLQTVPPRYPDTATAEALGIRELVAMGDSYFIGSPSGRDHNIRLAATKFDGLVIAPGETFSFNHFLGEVSAEAGYDEAYVTAGEQYAIEVGGGICQVSTTAFRAALRGGYPIVERWFHRYRVGYYELRGYGPGLDATVYAPSVDFRFTNDRPTPLLIETEVEEASHRLIFRFYSTDDGRQVEVGAPVLGAEVPPGPPIYQLDETLPPGTVTEWQTAANGLTATVERWVRDAAGNLLYHDVFVSRYEPRRAAYHYGPGYEPPQQ